MSVEKVILTNKKARFLYNILDTYEAGMVLKGTEVKSIRQSKVNIQESYAKIENNEVWLINSNISAYESTGYWGHEPKRKRKLLLNSKEIRKLIEATQEKGLTLIPLKLYFKNGRAKIEIGVCKGKKIFDKREDISKKDAKRDMDRAGAYKLKNR